MKFLSRNTTFFLLCTSLSCVLSSTIVQAQPDLSYYLPDSVRYDPAVPTPAAVIGHEVGALHVTHDRLVYYLHLLDKASDRVSMDTTGYTHEGRPLVLLTITSPANHSDIGRIRAQHLELSDPSKSTSLNTSGMPVVYYLGCSIHGNEASGSNAGLLIAYHLAAAQGQDTEQMLQNTIVLLDPSFNPDGLQRFSTWVNSTKSRMISSDPNDMEHRESWPGGRTNHYWFDLNRDWLVAQQPESQARIGTYHQWKPNVLTDHHEMGTHYTFFFQPGVPSRTHPLTPQRNFELTKRIGSFHARALDGIGSLYYTQEGYDDFYYGKGSTFPDVQGAVGILFEQASSRGHAQESENGLLTFPFAIRNQFAAALSSLTAVNSLREELLNYQRQFFLEAREESRRDPVKAMVFASKDRGRASLLAEIISRQDIAVYRSAKEHTINGVTYGTGSGYIIPMEQAQYKLLKAMFETRTRFRDSLFYDISTWTLSLAAGVDFEELRDVPALGERIDKVDPPKGKRIGGKSEYAYAFASHEYYAPRAVYRLLAGDISIKVATEPFFHPDGTRFERGSILIPLTGQTKQPAQIEFLLQQILDQDGIDIHAFSTGLDYRGTSLGSYSFRPLRKPVIAMLVGDGVTAGDAGEVWHLLDTRFEIPLTLLPLDAFNASDISRYNTIIFPQGTYGAVGEAAREKLKGWIRSGGVVIGFENALNWFQSAGLGNFQVKTAEASPAGEVNESRPYAAIDKYRGAQITSGAIFEARVDLTHPLLYGYDRTLMPFFKGNNLFLESSGNAYANPIVYSDTPLLSGYISRENHDKARGTSVVGVSSIGRGRVIGFTENLAFRAFWFGTNKLLMNAVYFGHLIDAASSR